jgi:hypothetical protein
MLRPRSRIWGRKSGSRAGPSTGRIILFSAVPSVSALSPAGRPVSSGPDSGAGRLQSRFGTPLILKRRWAADHRERTYDDLGRLCSPPGLRRLVRPPARVRSAGPAQGAAERLPRRRQLLVPISCRDSPGRRELLWGGPSINSGEHAMSAMFAIDPSHPGRLLCQ